MKVAFLLASILVVCSGAFCDGGNFKKVPATWSDAKCQKGKQTKHGQFAHGTKLMWCLPVGVSGDALKYQLKEYPTTDCKEHKCLEEVAKQCGYTYSEDVGFDIAQLHLAKCPVDKDDCRASIDTALAGALNGQTCTDADTVKYLNWIKDKCKKEDQTCKNSEHGCCADGVTSAKGPFNKGCCDYEKTVTGGVCSNKDATTGRQNCAVAQAVDECTAKLDDGTGTLVTANPRQASMVGKGYKCYCDSICDVTKDCCDGITELFCQPATGKKLSQAPKIFGR